MKIDIPVRIKNTLRISSCSSGVTGGIGGFFIKVRPLVLRFRFLEQFFVTVYRAQLRFDIGKIPVCQDDIAFLPFAHRSYGFSK